MERTIPTGGSAQHSNNPLSTASVETKVEAATKTAHQAVDKVADKATAQVGQLGGAAHRAVDSAADAASSAADWASTIPAQATRISDAASDSIRARPLATVAGALVVGYLLGRLAGL